MGYSRDYDSTENGTKGSRGQRGTGGGGVGMCSCMVCVSMCSNSVCAYRICGFLKGGDPKSLRITRIDSTSNDQESVFLSERAKLATCALAYQESKEGCTRPTEHS